MKKFRSEKSTSISKEATEHPNKNKQIVVAEQNSKVNAMSNPSKTQDINM